MPTSQELYQEYLDSKKEEAEKLYQEFHRTQEMPLIEEESKQRINQAVISDMSFLQKLFETPPSFKGKEQRDINLFLHQDFLAREKEKEEYDKYKESQKRQGKPVDETFSPIKIPSEYYPDYKDTLKQIPKTLGGMAIETGIGALGGLEGYVKKNMPTGAYKEMVEDLPPYAKGSMRMLGTMGRYALIGKIFAPLAPAIGNIEALQFLGPAYQVGIGSAVSRSLTWGTAKLVNNLSKVATDMEDPTLKNMFLQPLESFGWGALLGGIQGIGIGPDTRSISEKLEGSFTHFVLAGLIGGSRETSHKLYDTLIKNKDFTMKDVVDIGTSALFTAVIEEIGHHQVQEAWKKAEFDNYYHNKTVVKIMRTTGLSREEAEKEAQWMKDVVNDLKSNAPYVQVVAKKMDADFNLYSPKSQAKIIDRLKFNVENKGMSFSAAYFMAVDELKPELEKTKLLPFHEEKKNEKEQTGPTKTIPQLKKGHAVQNDLKKIGFTKEHINTLKGNKSFKQASKEEATRLIKKLEMAKEIAEEYSATDPEGLTDAGINKIVKRVNAIDKEVQNVNDFSEKIKEGTPAELINYNGKDYRLYDYARPSRKGFERDPFVYFNGYLPIHDGYTKTKINYEEKAQKAIKLAKKLKLTNEELKDIAERRHLMYFQQIKMSPNVAGRTLPILNDRQKEFDDFLTREYMWAHPYFKVKGFVPYQMYSPLLREMHELEGKVIGAFFPEKIPEMIKAFFDSERKSSKTEGLRTNALDDYLKYMKAGYKKKFMEGPMRDAQTNIIKNPLVKGTMKKALQQYATWMMGYPTAIEESYIAMFTDLGLKTEDAHQLARTLMNLTYSSAISPRPKLLAKQLLQNLNTANELGYSWAMSGLIDFINNGFSFDEARLAGVLTEYAPEVYQEYGKKYPLDKTRELLTWAFHTEDMFGRAIAYYAARNKWDYYYKKSKTIPEFMEKSGVNYLDKVIRWRIKEQLKKGNIYEARRIFYKEIVASAHYLYGKEDSPLAGKTSLGKMALQFKSWPINFGEHLIKNFKNKNYGFMWRQLLAILFLSAIGIKAKQKWMVGYPVTTFPMTRYSLRKFIGLPASLTMLEDIIALLGESTYRYLDSQDFDKAKKAFEKQLKTLGKDILFYLPGGLALKELYEIKDFIPFGQDNNQEYQGMAP